MGTIIFILFVIAEIVLTVLTCTKFREKKLWYRNRLAFTGGELLFILGVMLTAKSGWRFVLCAAVIGIRLLIAAVVFLIKRNKVQGEKSKVGRAVGTFFTAILFAIALVPAFLFRGYDGLERTGQYGVKSTSAILVDNSRVEKNESDGSFREIPVHLYYPDGDAENCPFVLFDHGSFGYYQSNDSLYCELASHGYVVASIDHPYYAFFTTDTSGKTIIVDKNFIQTAINMENDQVTPEEGFPYEREWLEVRSADENFVLDSLKAAKADGTLTDAWNTKNGGEILSVLEMTDMTKIGLTGHSIGGAMAVKLGRERDDITAVIDIDGTMLSERTDIVNGEYVFIDEPYPIPVLALDNEEHGTYYRTADGEQEYVNRHVMDNALDGREMSFAGTKHLDFTDLPLLSPAIVKIMGMGEANAEEFIPELNSIVLNYFNYYLKGEGEVVVEQWAK